MNQNTCVLKSSFGRSNHLTFRLNVNPVWKWCGGQNAVVSQTIGCSMRGSILCPFIRKFQTSSHRSCYIFILVYPMDRPDRTNDFFRQVAWSGRVRYHSWGCQRMKYWYLMHPTTHTCHFPAYFVHFMHQLCIFIASTCWIWILERSKVGA